MSTPRVGRRLVAILAAEVADYARLMGRDEAGTVGRLKALRKELIEPLLAEHHGRLVKLMGDGALVEFTSLIDAVWCAVEIQNGIARRQADVAADQRIAFRIGINLGDVIVEDDDIYGEGVNVASRLQTLAEPGGISISGTSYEMIQGRLDVPFREIGEREFKNMSRPIRVWTWGEESAPSITGGDEERQHAGRPSIAVLPFLNMSGDAEQEYFADGITEDIITDLSKVSGLFVIARNSVFAHKGKHTRVQDLSRNLGVRYVLEGSVRKAMNRVRITAQLIDGASGGHLWADRYDRDVTDIFAVQDDITHSIVDALKVRLLPKESSAISKVPTRNVEAYNFYLRGRQFFNRQSTRCFDIARKMFARAIEIDPGYARAHAGFADCEAFLLLFGDSGVTSEGVLTASGMALELDQDLAEAHASRGFALSVNGRFEEAERELQQAVELDPGLFEAHYFYAHACFRQGKHAGAAEHFARAAEVAPDDFQSLILLGCAYRSLGRDDAAAAAQRRGFERAERELELHPENSRAAYLGALALVSMGERARAEEWASRALWMDSDDFLVLYNVACVYARLGEREKAMALLERAMPRARRYLTWLRNDSDLDPLREEPRFKALITSAEMTSADSAGTPPDS
jgi:adenylate cyclase